MHFLYILKSIKNGKLYIGITRNVRKRFNFHNNMINISTKAFAPYKLLFIAIFPDKYKAARFEKYLKSASGKAFLNKRLI